MKQTEKAGAVQPGEGKVFWRLATSQYLKETYSKVGEGHFTRNCSDRSRESECKLKEGRFRLDVRKNFFYSEEKVPQKSLGFV